MADAAERAYTERSHAAAGWPIARWLRRLRGKSRGRAEGDLSPGPGHADSAVPMPSPVQQERAHAAARELGDVAAGSAPGPWRARIREVAAESGDQLPGALDESVASADLALDKRPRWWTIVGAAQWVGFAAVVVGAGWWLLAAGLSLFDMDMPEAAVQCLPLPGVLVVAGVVVGVVVSVLAGWAARRGGRRRAEAVRRALRSVIMSTGDSVDMITLRSEIGRAHV